MQIAKGCTNYLITPFTLFAVFLITGFLSENIYLYAFSLLFLGAGVGMLYFFRDPELPVEGGIVSPADGVVTGYFEKENTAVIQIFMNLYNIHVNRFPMDGKVISVEHREGGHLPAFDKDAETNERVITEMETEIGRIKIVQIAGAVARRIVPYCSPSMKVRKGERMGIIRFGSRVDLYLPTYRAEFVVRKGDKVHPGKRVAKVKERFSEGQRESVEKEDLEGQRDYEGPKGQKDSRWRYSGEKRHSEEQRNSEEQKDSNLLKDSGEGAKE